jgi:glycosyltransferase involved in cell wall biosynthesis
MSTLLFDARLLLNSPTGIGQYIVALFPELLRAAPDIHFHFLCAPHVWEGYPIEQWQAENLTIHRRAWRHMSFQQQWLIPQFARSLSADVIHYPHFDAPVWMSALPVVATIHDAKYLVHPEFFPRMSAANRAYMRFAFATTLRRARRVISVSHATATDLKQLFRFPPHHLQVIHEAVDPSFAPVTEEALAAFRSHYGLERPYILTVGELRPHKNHTTLLTAYAQSLSRDSHDLVIIGRQHSDSPDLQAMIAAHHLEGKVHLLTDVDDEGLRAAYTGAELFILVSLYEGFGLPILEAMACGVPVIGSNNTATAEVIGEGGIHVAPTDPAAIAAATDHLLSNPAIRQALIERGNRWHRRFTWQRAAEETVALYREALETGKE